MDLLLPGIGLALWTLLSLAWLVLIIVVIVKLANNEKLSAGSKLLWFAFILVFPIIGSVAYLINRKSSN